MQLTEPRELRSVEELRPQLHQKIEELGEPDLRALHRTVLQMEIDRLASEIGEEFDRLRAEGKLTDASVEAAIREHRQRHPYR